MKIAFLSFCQLEFGGGFENYLVYTSKNINELCDKADVDIFSMDDSFSKKISLLLSIFYLKNISNNVAYKESGAAILKKIGGGNYIRCKNFKELSIRLKEYDVVYAKGEILDAFLIKFFIRYKNLPPVVYVCGTTLYYPGSDKNFYSILHNWLYSSFVYRNLVGGAKAFHVKNKSDEYVIKKILPQKKIVKIYNPIDINKLLMDSKKYKNNFNWDKTKFNIIWVGRLTSQKGVDDLVGLVEALNKTNYKDKIVWNIAGEGIEKSKIISLGNKWSNVNYFGHVDNNYIADLYINNNLFISTSKFESFGNTIIEAQALNLPVISYNIPGPNEIILNKKTGMLVPDIKKYIESIKGFVDRNIVLELEPSKEVGKKFNKCVITKNLVVLLKNASEIKK